MPVAHAALQLHANYQLLAGGGDFGAIVERVRLVSVMNTGAVVLHIYCYWTWLSVVVHTLLWLAMHPPPLLPPACLAKGRLPKYR